MPDTLSQALREVVDASAEPVSVDEVMGLPEAVPRNRPRVPLLLAAAAVVLIAVVGGVVLAGQDGDDSSTDRQIPASTPTVAPEVEVPAIESCLVRPLVGQERHPCSVTDAQAEVMLDIPVNEPAGIPEGWTLVYHDVRWYRAADYGLPHELGDYNRAWFRNGFVRDSRIPCDEPEPAVCDGDYIQVVVRNAFPGEADTGRRAPHIGRHAPGVDSFTMSWVANDRSYRVWTQGVDDNTALAVANSLA